MSMGKKWMKRVAVSMMVACAIAGLSGCGNKEDSSSASGSNVAKVGFINGTTGAVAGYGLSEQQGLNLAVEEINKEGKIHLEVEEQDTQGQVSQAVNVVQKMIGDHKSVLIGPLISSEYKAVIPLVEQAKIPLVGVAITAEGATDNSNYLFRVCVPESENIPQTVNKTHEKLGYKTTAILYSSNNEHQVSAYKVFKRSLEAAGVKIVDTETFADKDSDFSAQLTKIEATKPDVVVVAAYYQEGALILKKMREMGMNQPVLGDNGFMSPELTKMAGAAANNVYVSSMWTPERNNPETKNFVEKFKAKYGQEPDNFAACAYVAMKYVAKAMETAGTTTDTAKIRDAMANIKNFNSAIGPLSFNNKGTPDVDLVLLKIENGQYKAQ